MTISISESPVRIPVEGAAFDGALVIPAQAAGIVVLANGSASARFSPGNTFIAAALQKAGFATLQIDLLTGSEADEPDYRFNAAAAGRRLGDVISWTRGQPKLRDLPVGLFGAGTGAAAALIAAALPGSPVRSIVSCSGRPELAGPALEGISAATLFVVGGFDWAILDLNEAAAEKLKVPGRMEVVASATKYFEEEGALDQVVSLAREWFGRWLGGPGGDLR